MITPKFSATGLKSSVRSLLVRSRFLPSDFLFAELKLDLDALKTTEALVQQELEVELANMANQDSVPHAVKNLAESIKAFAASLKVFLGIFDQVGESRLLRRDSRKADRFLLIVVRRSGKDYEGFTYPGCCTLV